jgi:hypothetical protein
VLQGGVLRVRYADKVANVGILDRMRTELKFLRSRRGRKMECAGHVPRGSGDLAHLQILEGRLEGK